MFSVFLVDKAESRKLRKVQVKLSYSGPNRQIDEENGTRCTSKMFDMFDDIHSYINTVISLESVLIASTLYPSCSISDLSIVRYGEDHDQTFFPHTSAPDPHPDVPLRSGPHHWNQGTNGIFHLRPEL